MMTSQPPIQITNKKSGLFIYLLFLTLFFIALEISFFIQSSELYLGDFRFISNQLKIPPQVFFEIGFFISIQLFLHLLFTFIVWCMARLISVAVQCEWKTTEKLGFILWILGMVTLLLANHFFYPNSKFAALVDFILNEKVSVFLLIVCSFTLLLGAIFSLWGLSILISRRVKFIVLGLCLIAMSGMFYHAKKRVITEIAKKPNIILIGIDSLRPDALGYFGFEKQTPHLDHFLNHATVFSDSVTTVARTFPAWISILTSIYPKHSRVRFNLPDLKDTRFDIKTMLPMMLREQGYQTLFATDETRFSNIDKNFGFDQTVTPPIGFNDFLLGTLNDFPMANLLVNTPIGRFLFPYSYANRPAFITYNPDSFIKLLQSVLSKPRQKPLFLAVHFCLPHNPYLWADYATSGTTVFNYHAAVHRVDQQFKDFMDVLKKNNLLKNSIVVLLSDHGEAIELPGDRVTENELFVAGAENKKKVIPQFYPPSFDFEKINQSAGHGTDVLSLTQLHNVLAFRLYGEKKNKAGAVSATVSLLDIKPTLLDFLGISTGQKNDGVSLADVILGKKVTFVEKDFFMESDFSPEAIRSVHPETRDLIFEGIDYFRIDPVSARLSVKKSMGQLIISSKQLADMYQGWILALYPKSHHKMIPILVNLHTGEWTNDLNTPFAKHSPAQHMMKALKRFYGEDIIADQILQ